MGPTIIYAILRVDALWRVSLLLCWTEYCLKISFVKQFEMDSIWFTLDFHLGIFKLLLATN